MDMKIAMLIEKTAVTVLYLYKNLDEYLNATFIQRTKKINCFPLLTAGGKGPFHSPGDVTHVHPKEEEGECYQAFPKLFQ